MSRYHCHTNNVCSHGVYENNDEVPWVCAVQNSSSNPFCVVYSACLSGWSSVAKGQSATAITALLKNGNACTQIALGPPLNATRIRETIMKQHWRSETNSCHTLMMMITTRKTTLKENQSEDASWSENLENVPILSSAGFVWLFCQHSYKMEKKLSFYIQFELLGGSYVGSLFKPILNWANLYFAN